MRLSIALLACATLASPAMAGTAVPVDHFRSVQLRGGGHVTLRRGDAQRVTLVSGSTQFTRFRVDHGDQLVIDACDSDCPQHYDLDIEIVTPNIDGVSINGGGKIETASSFGRQEKVAAAIEGGGEIDIRSLEAAEANAAVDGGGDIQLKASGRLMAAVNGGGDIVYWGNPQVTSAVSGGGAVSKGN
ncbi:MAG TPA: DUF2807 domain-containing protein [Rhizomicrobium sp.]|nr:DUF2807 domain-containing protein [Rhizomicrobium sp.]